MKQDRNGVERNLLKLEGRTEGAGKKDSIPPAP
jgi:hypothetical protein